MEKETGYASINRPWLKYYPEIVKDFKMPELSIYQLLEKNSQQRLDKVAMRYFDFAISYKKYLQNIENSAKSLAELGTKKDEIVLLALPNIPECRTLIYALNILGSISYPINPMMAPNEMDRILKENEVKTIFMFEGFYQKYAKPLMDNKSLHNVVILTGEESIPKVALQLKNIKERLNGTYVKKENSYSVKDINWKEFVSLKKYCLQKIEPFYKQNHVATIIGTSGTTGTSKGVCLTNENLNAMALQHLLGNMNFKPGDRILDILIQSIGYGIAVAHYSGVCGLESILIPTLVTDIFPLLEKYHPSHFTGGPIHYDNLVSVCKEKNCRPPYAKNMVSGGATLEKKTERFLNNIEEDTYIEKENDEKIFVRQGLGCTENGGAATYAKKGTYKFGGVGIPLALENMGIFKPGTDEELTYGQVGEICISGPTVMKGYLNNPLETEKVLKKHRDGKIWLHMLDLGTMDEDGQVYFISRIKDIFMRKGFNVHPKKIQEFISSLPNVKECYVTGVTHPEEQMVPVAFICLNETTNLEQNKEFIIENCFKNLEETSIPYEFVFVDTIPRNLGGKVDAKVLLEKANINYQNKNKTKTLSLIHINE